MAITSPRARLGILASASAVPLLTFTLIEPYLPNLLLRATALVAAGVTGFGVAYWAGRGLGQSALQQSEEKFRQLFANNPHPMWVFDRQSLRFLEVNQAAVDKYGYTHDEFLAMKITGLLMPDDLPKLVEVVRRAAGQNHHAGVWRHRLHDGRFIDVDIYSHDITFAGSQSARMVVAQDVTERRRAEEARSLIGRIFATSLDLILVTDRVGNFIQVSPSALPLLGYTPAEMIGHSGAEFI